MAFGLSLTGFEAKRLSDIKTEIENEVKSKLGASVNTIAPSTLATIIGIVAEREMSIWELSEEVYNSQYPDTAEGAALDNVVAITGITRLQATFSKIVGQLLFGTNGTLVPAGTIFSVDGNPDARFLTDSDATLIVGTDEVQKVTFSATPTAGSFKLKSGDQTTASIAFNASAAAVQTALNDLSTLSGVTVSGSISATGLTITYAGADGKQDQPTIEVLDNTLVNGVTPVTSTVVTLTPGVAQGSVNMTAETVGAVQAPALTLTVIETPVSGLDSTKNPLDADMGRETETDLELRERRDETLQIAGAGTVEAIRSKLLNLDDVTDVIVFENTSEVEVDGRPAKSYEAVVNGGDEDEIAQTIWETKPAGIRTFGNQSDIVIDTQGFSQDVQWSRPTDIDVWVDLTVTTDSDFPVDGAARVENAIVARGNAFGIGKDVIVYPKLICALDEIPGIVDVVIKVGIAPSPTLDDNIDIDPDEISRFDTSRVGVVIL